MELERLLVPHERVLFDARPRRLPSWRHALRFYRLPLIVVAVVSVALPALAVASASRSATRKVVRLDLEELHVQGLDPAGKVETSVVVPGPLFPVPSPLARLTDAGPATIPLVAFLVALLALAEVVRLARWKGSHYVLTSHRLLVGRGLLGTITELPVLGVEHVHDDGRGRVWLERPGATLSLDGLDVTDVATLNAALDGHLASTMRRLLPSADEEAPPIGS